MLEHVHEEELVGEHVQRRDERADAEGERADEAAQPPHGCVPVTVRLPAHRPPARHVGAGEGRGGDDRHRVERPGEPRAHQPILPAPRARDAQASHGRDARVDG